MSKAPNNNLFNKVTGHWMGLEPATFTLKAHRQISKKHCFKNYCSCDQACQFSAA